MEKSNGESLIIARAITLEMLVLTLRVGIRLPSVEDCLVFCSKYWWDFYCIFFFLQKFLNAFVSRPGGNHDTSESIKTCFY